MHKIYYIFLILALAFIPNSFGQSKTPKKNRTKVEKNLKKKPRKKKKVKKKKKKQKKTKAQKAAKAKSEQALAKEQTKNTEKEKEKEEEEEEEEEEPEKEFKAKFLVEILPDEPIRKWVAKAIEYKVNQDLSEFSKLIPATKDNIIEPPCEGDDCDNDTIILASIYFNGLLRENSLWYEIQDLDSRQLLQSGSIPFNKNIGLPELRVKIFGAMKPIIGKSGLIDRLEAKARIALAREARDKKIQEIVKKQTEEELQEAAEEEAEEKAKELAAKQAPDPKSTEGLKNKDKKPKDKKTSKEKNTAESKEKGKSPELGEKGKSKQAEGEPTEKKDEESDEEKLANAPPPEPDWWQIAVDHIHVFAEKNREDLKLVLALLFAIITLAPVIFFSLYQAVARGSSQLNRSLVPFLLIAVGITLTVIYIQGAQFIFDFDPKKYNVSLESFPDLKWVGPIFGGFLFGYLLIICLKSAIPLIHGFEEIEHRMISLVLRAWSWLTFVRMVLITPILISFMILIFLSAIVFEVDRYLFYSLLLPLGGLYAWFWTSYMIENFAINLDKACVYGPATKKNPWDPCIRAYLSQYFKRAGLEADPKFLNDIIFLPHKENDVDTYGGGLSKARVVVSRKILSYALNIPEEAPPKVSDKENVPVEFGDEITKPEQILSREEIDAGEGEADAGPNASDDLEDSKDKRIRTEFMKLEDFQKITSFKKYEIETPQNSGGGGFAVKDEPEQTLESDEEVTKTSNRDVVEETRTEIIREDQIYRVKKEADANFQIEIESSASDYHDFLFGLLLSEIGHVLKRGSGINTLELMTARVNSKLPQFLSKILERIFAAYHRNFARFSLILSDSIAQIYRGEPHLLQYLYFIESGNQKVLSKNAEKKELSKTSDEILGTIETWIPELSKQESNISLLQKRLLWLKGYFYSFTKEEKRYNRATKLFKILAPAFLLVFVSYKVIDSSLYYSVYFDRIAAQQKALDDKKKEQEAKEKEIDSLNLPIKK